MIPTLASTADPLGAQADVAPAVASAGVSAVSWPAIIAGAVVAVAVAIILIALGTGVGLATVSPWPQRGASPKTFTVVAAIWLLVVQWIASAAGGYLTGRLRVRWVATHTHEVFFRDTANGFISWALALLIGALVVGATSFSAVGNAAGAIASEGVAAASGAAAGPDASSDAAPSGLIPYTVDKLFRGAREGASATNDARAEAALIFDAGLAHGGVSPADAAYLAQLVSANSTLPQPQAQLRVAEAVATLRAADARAREAADTARKAGAAASIYTALSTVVGAFVACVAAALGGRRRDEHV